MEKLLKVNVSRDRLEAYLDVIKPLSDNDTFSQNELEAFLIKNRVKFGILYDELKRICENPLFIQYPILIAKGIPSENGVDSYLQNEIMQEESVESKKLNFRDVLKIPSVRNGQLLATIIPPTQGKNGTDVFGSPILAKNGKLLRIRAGKNVVLNDNQFFSSIDGQLSITDKMISVNPVFEVRGDIDLKTGNVNFVGNVVIRGDVPTGYEIRSGGDIKVGGIVEGAYLEAAGNIIVSGGVTGGNRGKLIAGGNIQASYLNQTEVKAGQDVLITSSILHSHVQARNSIICQNGPIIGGQLKSGKNIQAKEFGNHLYTKTDLYIGWDPTLEETEIRLREEINNVSSNLKKLLDIERQLVDMIKRTGKVTEDQRAMLQKQKTTKEHLQNELASLNEQILEIEHDRQNNTTASASVTDTAYPNTTIHFGKYARNIQHRYTYTKFYFSNGEINFEPID